MSQLRSGIPMSGNEKMLPYNTTGTENFFGFLVKGN